MILLLHSVDAYPLHQLHKAMLIAQHLADHVPKRGDFILLEEPEDGE